MNDLITSRWTFGGPLADAPPETAWTLLAIAAALGAIFAWVSYRHSVRRLGVGPCVLLMLLRTVTLLLLLFCLANPVRIERQTGKPPEPPPPGPPPRLAVVIDRSDSMTLPDNRGRSRLDDALVNWRRIEKTAQTYFGPTQYFSLAEDLRPAQTLEEAVKRTGGTGETRLYRTIAALLKNPPGERPDAVVVLTDGVDTSNDPEAVLRDAALAASVPVYFVAGSNRAPPPEPFVRVRELRAPPTALRSSEFTVEASFEAFSRTDRTVPFSLWQGDRRIQRGELALTMGPNLLTRSFPVLAGERGAMEFSLRLGAGDDAPLTARVTTHVLTPRTKKLRVLVYQSALDWGLRYFTSALRADATFEYFTIVTPDVGMTVAGGSQPGSTLLGRLPDAAEPLHQFDCLVLVRLYPKRLSATQQQAVINFAREGGSVLFMSPDAEAMTQFSAAPLRTLLPVYLPDETPESAAADAKVTREDIINRIVKSTDLPRERSAARLTPFVLTETGRASPIFARAEGSDGEFLLPRFLEYVTLNRPKPGTDVLAVHPSGVDAESGRPHILLATQPFGLGRSALLTTDTLWRWKLDEPSTSRVVQTFWQQFLLAIARRGEGGSLRFADVPTQVRIGQPTTLRLDGAKSDRSPVVQAKGPDGRSVSLPVKRSAEADAPWSVTWTPPAPGGWEFVAEADGAPRTSIFLSAVAEPTGELAASVPALGALRALAGETGGMLLTHEAPAAWRKEGDAGEKKLEVVTNERTTLRWNVWKILYGALGCYALELVLRRLWKLL